MASLTPICVATHDADGTWQVLCGTTNDSGDGRLACLGCLFERDPSIGVLADLPRGWRAWRESVDDPWHRERDARDDATDGEIGEDGCRHAESPCQGGTAPREEQAMARRPSDVWASGPAYESYVGRWSRLVAREFLRWLAVPPGRRWIEVGCGTGALTGTILAMAAPDHVEAVDQSAGYVEYARAQVPDPRVRFAVGDARRLPQDAGSADAVVSGLVLNFVPEPGLAVAEMARVVRPGGTVAVYLWDYAGRMELMRHFWDAATALDPAAADLDEGRRFPICRPEPLEALFRESGLVAVETRAIDVPTVFRDFDDYWSPFLGGQGPAPGYTMSLDEERRAGLRDRVRATLPVRPDGSIALVARAWAARGTRPAS